MEKITTERARIEGDGFVVPAVMFLPARSSSIALIVHGYGGNKEEQLGLAWRIAETGIATCAIDLRGHGEHRLPFDEKVALDVSSAIAYCRSLGRVVVIGHSLGARLALLSDVDHIIAVSPALDSAFSPQTLGILKEMRSHRVREAVSIPDLFAGLPLYKPAVGRKVLCVYGERDAPEIQKACGALQAAGERVVRIDNALHGDIWLLEPTFEIVKRQLDEWTRTPYNS